MTGKFRFIAVRCAASVERISARLNERERQARSAPSPVYGGGLGRGWMAALSRGNALLSCVPPPPPPPPPRGGGAAAPPVPPPARWPGGSRARPVVHPRAPPRAPSRARTRAPRH